MQTTGQHLHDQKHILEGGVEEAGPLRTGRHADDLVGGTDELQNRDEEEEITNWYDRVVHRGQEVQCEHQEDRPAHTDELADADRNQQDFKVLPTLHGRDLARETSVWASGAVIECILGFK